MGRKKTRHRKKRQRRGDYRIFVGAFPTGEVAQQIQAVRDHYDPGTARITQPHVTLAGTYWRSGPATAANEALLIERLRRAAEQIRPFELFLGGVYTFGSRVAYLGVKPTPALLAVRRKLLDAVGPDKHRRFRPHLTLAMRLNKEEMAAMVAELKEGQWESGRYAVSINKLHLMQRGPDDPAWRSIAQFPL